MNFEKTAVSGAVIVQGLPVEDGRGYFARIFCQREFEAAGIQLPIVQSNLCCNKKKGTLRGLHTQLPGAEEAKLVCCTRGRVFDVCVDVRAGSETFGAHVGVELSEENHRMLYLPKGCAHGYLTLEEDCQLLYFMGEFYQPNRVSGYRYDDPKIGIQWPLPPPYILSEQDTKWGYLEYEPWKGNEYEKPML